MNRDPEHALVLRPGALGDTLMLVPALRALHDRYETTVAGRGPGLSLLRPFAARCVDFEGGGWHRLFEDPTPGNPPTDPFPPHRVAAFVRDEDGRVGRNLKIWFPASCIGVFPGVPPKGYRGHAAAYLSECLQKVGFAIDPMECMRRARETALLVQGTPASEQSGIVLHPGSGGRRKNYPPAFWRELVRAFRNAGKGIEDKRLTVLLGPAEDALKEEVRSWDPQGELDIVPTPEMEDLLSLLAHAELYVGHDSGVTHLAAMLGVPSIALFRNSDPDVWGPLGPRVQVIAKRNSDRERIEATLGAVREFSIRAANFHSYAPVDGKAGFF